MKKAYDFFFKYYGVFLAALGILILGFVVGWFFPEEGKQAGMKLMEQKIASAGNINIGYIFINNLTVAAMLVLTGFLLIVPPFIVFANGLIMGIVISVLVRETSPAAITMALLPHGIFEITAILIAAGLGILIALRITRNILEPDWKTLMKNSALLFVSVIMPLLLIAAVAEMTISKSIAEDTIGHIGSSKLTNELTAMLSLGYREDTNQIGTNRTQPILSVQYFSTVVATNLQAAEVFAPNYFKRQGITDQNTKMLYIWKTNICTPMTFTVESYSFCDSNSNRVVMVFSADSVVNRDLVYAITKPTSNERILVNKSNGILLDLVSYGEASKLFKLTTAMEKLGYTNVKIAYEGKKIEIQKIRTGK